MAEHTKGPWCVDETAAFGAYGVWTDYVTHPGHDGAGYGSQICSMFTPSFKQTDAATRGERDANARLIAAAPNLLAVCRKMAAVLQGFTADELKRRVSEIHPAAFDEATEAMWAAVNAATVAT